MDNSLELAIDAARGHFRYESGHHGDLWLDLDRLFVKARRMRAWAAGLAQAASTCQPDVVCGPLTGGAFVAQLVAVELDTAFVFAERVAGELVRYRIPEPLRQTLPGQRVLLVDDAVNAGSALLGTLAELLDCGAELAGFASLLTMGEVAGQIAAQYGIPFFTLASLERQMWTPEACPLCTAGVPFVDRVA